MRAHVTSTHADITKDFATNTANPIVLYKCSQRRPASPPRSILNMKKGHGLRLPRTPLLQVVSTQPITVNVTALKADLLVSYSKQGTELARTTGRVMRLQLNAQPTCPQRKDSLNKVAAQAQVRSSNDQDSTDLVAKTECCSHRILYRETSMCTRHLKFVKQAKCSSSGG